MSSKRPEDRVFGRRATSHVLILASGEKVRHMTVRPWMAAVSVCVCAALAVGYLGATAYLVLRDDLIGGTMARQARMQHDYEDRIAALRAQVDRVTSRQLLDQQVVEEKVETLLRQQMALSSRHGKLGELMDKAETIGLDTGATDESSANDGLAPGIEPQAYQPDKRAAVHGGAAAIEGLISGRAHADAGDASPPAFDSPTLRSGTIVGESAADKADRMFSRVTLSLKSIERQQMDRIATLTANADKAASEITRILQRTGIDLPALRTASIDTPADAAPLVETAALTTQDDADAIGGPFVEPEQTDTFSRSLVALDTALTRLDTVRNEARRVPVSNPAPTSPITSRFGNRVDPFFGRLALHAGIDFRATVGQSVRVTAAGTVVSAGKAGSYGNMVEVDHGNGVTTRYAHLSAITVVAGDKVRLGQTIGRAGNTGRSTGPHLHYEVRINGQAVDPMRFLNAGIKLGHYIE